MMDMEHAKYAQQGHKYLLGEDEVLALESGALVTVQEIDRGNPYPLGKKTTVKASWLRLAPMRYFHGEIPK